MNEKNSDFSNLTPSQKYNKSFEELCSDIVKLIFQGQSVDIKRTGYSKDGGYDIVVEWLNHSHLKKIFFECKLRSKNLNLRDIAANVIIAFNEGAIALVIITNVDYTEQAGNNLDSFYKKSILNIKILTGNETKELVMNNHICVPGELEPILCNKKTIGKQKYDVLRFDLTKKNLYSQILERTGFSDKNDAPYITYAFRDLCDAVTQNVYASKLIVIHSLVGTGKTTLIHFIARENNYFKIHIMADSLLSPTLLLLEILLNIWGISYSSVIHEFTDDNINAIAKVIEKNSNDKKYAKTIAKIIRRILGEKDSSYNSDELFNYAICRYIVHVVQSHSEIKYLFHIEHAEYAAKEVQIIMVYLCKLFQEHKISCIIERDEEEYRVQSKTHYSIFIDQLNKIEHVSIEIPLLESQQALDYIRLQLPEMPEYIHQLIYEQAGNRLLTLSSIISYAKNEYEQTYCYKSMCNVIKIFSKHELPQCIETMLKYSYEQNRKILEYLYICNFEMPLEVLDFSFSESKDLDSIENLCNLGILDLKSSKLTTTNLIIKEIVKKEVHTHRLSLIIHAKELDDFLGDVIQKSYPSIQLNILRILGRGNELEYLLKQQITYAKRNRHYTELIRYSKILLKYDMNIEKKLQSLIDILEVMIIQKEINTESATSYMKEYESMLSSLAHNKQLYYKKILNYFKGKAIFKNGDYKKCAEFTKSYYSQLELASRDERDEWLAKLCVIYTLSIKELEGNKLALECFKKLMQVFPDSYDVTKEYQSHIGCMELFRNPHKSINCYTKIINEFKRSDIPLLAIPFHEYGDKAMSAVCAKRFDAAYLYCDDALDIIESNGILGELGRIYNIKGCLALCENDFESAKKFWKDAVASLDINDYPLYGWRAYLNYAYILTLTEPKENEASIFNLERAYHIFKTIYADKLLNISSDKDFYTSREYFAILLFIKVYHNLGKNNIDGILSDLKIDFLKKHIDSDLRKIKEKSGIYECSYSIKGHIFMIA